MMDFFFTASCIVLAVLAMLRELWHRFGAAIFHQNVPVPRTPVAARMPLQPVDNLDWGYSDEGWLILWLFLELNGSKTRQETRFLSWNIYSTYVYWSQRVKEPLECEKDAEIWELYRRCSNIRIFHYLCNYVLFFMLQGFLLHAEYKKKIVSISESEWITSGNPFLGEFVKAPKIQKKSNLEFLSLLQIGCFWCC